MNRKALLMSRWTVLPGGQTVAIIEIKGGDTMHLFAAKTTSREAPRSGSY